MSYTASQKTDKLDPLVHNALKTIITYNMCAKRYWQSIDLRKKTKYTLQLYL